MDNQEKINYIEKTLEYNIPNRAYKNNDQYAMEWGYDTWNELLANINDDLVNEMYEVCVNDNRVNEVELGA
jgi:hypothetical protein